MAQQWVLLDLIGNSPSPWCKRLTAGTITAAASSGALVLGAQKQHLPWPSRSKVRVGDSVIVAEAGGETQRNQDRLSLEVARSLKAKERVAGKCPSWVSGGAASQHCILKSFSPLCVQYASHSSIIQIHASQSSLIGHLDYCQICPPLGLF